MGHSTADLHRSQLRSHLCACGGRAVGLKHSWLADHRGQWGPKLLRTGDPWHLGCGAWPILYVSLAKLAICSLTTRDLRCRSWRCP